METELISMKVYVNVTMFSQLISFHEINRGNIHVLPSLATVPFPVFSLIYGLHLSESEM